MMAFGGFTQGKTQQPMAEINMVPLIDVMLVLLVIFMIAAPMMTHAVKVDLPKASSHPDVNKTEPIQLSMRSNGDVFWGTEKVSESAWRQRMEDAAKLDPQPEIHLRVDGDLDYRYVVAVMSDAAKVGLTKIAFVTDPKTTD
jgi:biopolymer transport protein ExbD